jgi:hypothetical protein
MDRSVAAIRRFRVELSVEAARDISLRFDHLFESHATSGEVLEEPIDHSEERIRTIAGRTPGLPGFAHD